jgi:NAD(P)H dehydrogenase (quinone)
MASSARDNRPKHVVILCHPSDASFNKAVADRYCETARAFGHEVLLRDLYRMNFNPILSLTEMVGAKDYAVSDDVLAELSVINGAKIFVLVYPIWFGTPPAMMKGYIERVLGAGFSHRAIQAREPNLAVRGARLVSFSSSGTSIQWLEEQGAWISLRTIFDNYLSEGFSMSGDDHIHFSSIVEGLCPRSVDRYLEEVGVRARQLCINLTHVGRAGSALGTPADPIGQPAEPPSVNGPI